MPKKKRVTNGKMRCFAINHSLILLARTTSLGMMVTLLAEIIQSWANFKFIRLHVSFSSLTVNAAEHRVLEQHGHVRLGRLLQRRERGGLEPQTV